MHSRFRVVLPILDKSLPTVMAAIDLTSARLRRGSYLWVSARAHRVTRRVPAEVLAEERAYLHPLPAHPYTAAFGVTRTVGVTAPMVAFDNGSLGQPFVARDRS